MSEVVGEVEHCHVLTQTMHEEIRVKAGGVSIDNEKHWITLLALFTIFCIIEKAVGKLLTYEESL